METKAELPQQSRKASLPDAQTYLLSFPEKQQGVCIPTETLNISLQLFINLRKGCGVTQTSQTY
jgi:hypothetical protein